MFRKSLAGLYLALGASAFVWGCVGASVPMIVMGHYEAAVVMLLLALCVWPLRLKVKVHSVKADSFEEAMRQIAEIERRDGR